MHDPLTYIPELDYDRVWEYEGVTYYIVEFLRDERLLVTKEHPDSGNFPIQTYIIPRKRTKD